MEEEYGLQDQIYQLGQEGWKIGAIGDEGIQIRSNTGEHICWIEREPMLAHAHLIKAVPRMLTAMHKALSKLVEHRAVIADEPLLHELNDVILTAHNV